MKSLFDQSVTTFGGIDVLVHTAGIMPLASVADMSLESFDRVQRTNVRGTFVVNRLAARQLRRAGAIINFSTSVTRLQPPTFGAYAASKGAVEPLTLVPARELVGRDITVNAVAPGPTATPLFLKDKPASLVGHIATLNPMGRLGGPVRSHGELAASMGRGAGAEYCWSITGWRPSTPTLPRSTMS